MQVYPNPTTEQLTVRHPAATIGATVTVYALDGRKLATVPSAPGSTETRVALRHLASGSYLLLYTADGVRQAATISKE